MNQPAEELGSPASGVCLTRITVHGACIATFIGTVAMKRCNCRPCVAAPMTIMPTLFVLVSAAALLEHYFDFPVTSELRTFIANEYMPKTRTAPGMDALPGGAAWYAFNAKNSTTTDLTPDQIHAIGLSEVARIHGLIRTDVMGKVGFKGSLQEFFQFMQNDPRRLICSSAA